MRIGPLGWLPVLSVTTAVGLLVVAIADTRARFADGSAPVLLWVGVLIVFVPIVARLLTADVPRNERLGLLILLGAALYLVKVFHDPLMFTFYDEFLHVRTAQDIVSTGRLFAPNPVLLASPLYPGLESATSAVSTLGGASIFQAGVVLIGLARIVLVMALFLLFELLSKSGRLASIGVVVYATNPSFLFFSAQFAYESLALPLAVLSLYVVLRRYRRLDGQRASWALIALMVAGTVVTHHVSSLGLSVVLVSWAVVHHLRRDGDPQAVSPLRPALFAVAATVAWLVTVANVTIGYLQGPIDKAISDVFGLVTGTLGPRQLFQVPAGLPDPAWERAIAFAAVLLILLGLPLGLWQLRKRHLLRNSLVLALAIGSLSYPLTLLARLTEWAAEVAARATTFVFLAVALTISSAIVWVTLRKAQRRGTTAALLGVFVILFMGGIIIAVPPWARLPGPYLVGADQRSIEPEGIAAASWASTYLGPGNRFLADRTNSALLATIGRQHPVTVAGDNLNIYAAFFSTSVDSAARQALRAGAVRYVIIDRRLSTSLPLVGIYTEKGEANAGPRTEPIDAQALNKFDSVTSVSRLYDSGDIQVYDVGALTGATAAHP